MVDTSFLPRYSLPRTYKIYLSPSWRSSNELRAAARAKLHHVSGPPRSVPYIPENPANAYCITNIETSISTQSYSSISATTVILFKNRVDASHYILGSLPRPNSFSQPSTARISWAIASASKAPTSKAKDAPSAQSRPMLPPNPTLPVLLSLPRSAPAEPSAEVPSNNRRRRPNGLQPERQRWVRSLLTIGARNPKGRRASRAV